jgi:hypothetical protein
MRSPVLHGALSTVFGVGLVGCPAFLSDDWRIVQEAGPFGIDGSEDARRPDLPDHGSGADGPEDATEGGASSRTDGQTASDATDTMDAALDAITEADVTSETDATVDADAAAETGADGSAADADASTMDAGLDCGATNTVQNCTTCGTPCDTAHSLGASCNGVACTYSGCASGRLDCDKTPPNANGCETASSTSNCGACGQACDTSTGTPSCSGTSCIYACNPGRSDCNAVTAPDTDGCECATPNCCGSSCQTVHSNGVGQSFYDCAPSGTYNATEQLAACAAFTGDATKCTNVSSLCLFVQPVGVCSTGASQCYCWYLPNPPAPDASGPPLGLVQSSTSSTCMCPSATGPTWN